jgi:peptide/nickel transport system substrate-binding protein
MTHHPPAPSRRSLLGAAAALALAPPVRAATPKRGGHLRLGLAGGSTADTLDPQPWGDTFMVTVGFATRGNLTEIAADGSLRGEIAESWEGTDGAKRWVFKLRNGVTFSNGKNVTAEDVIASLNLHRGDASRSGAKGIFTPVTDIRADGPQAVVITLSSGNVDFPAALTDHHINIVPALDGQADWRSGIGAGPYILETFEPGVRAILRRNPNSYKTGHVDSVEILGISDVVARQAALTSGRVDVINRADLKTVRLLGRQPGLRVEQSAGRLYYTLTQDLRVAPFDNLDVRRALKHGLDREAVLRTVFNGFGAVGNDQPLTAAYGFHDPSLKPPAYDPDRARFHLRKAGLETLTAQLHVSDAAFNGAVDLAVLYQQHAARAGITLDIQRLAPDGYWANISRKKPWYATYWSGRATEDTIFTVAFSKGSPWNGSHWENPRFNALLAEARVQADAALRRELFAEAQRLVSEDGGDVIPIFAHSVYALADKVQHGPDVSGHWELDGARLVERWWLA